MARMAVTLNFSPLLKLLKGHRNTIKHHHVDCGKIFQYEAGANRYGNNARLS
jgi:hypothetical protein